MHPTGPSGGQFTAQFCDCLGWVIPVSLILRPQGCVTPVSWILQPLGCVSAVSQILQPLGCVTPVSQILQPPIVWLPNPVRCALDKAMYVIKQLHVSIVMIKNITNWIGRVLAKPRMLRTLVSKNGFKCYCFYSRNLFFYVRYYRWIWLVFKVDWFVWFSGIFCNPFLYKIILLNYFPFYFKIETPTFKLESNISLNIRMCNI